MKPHWQNTKCESSRLDRHTLNDARRDGCVEGDFWTVDDRQKIIFGQKAKLFCDGSSLSLFYAVLPDRGEGIILDLLQNYRVFIASFHILGTTRNTY